MDQIVPSILFNMQIRDNGDQQQSSPVTTIIPNDDHPEELAEIILKDLFFRAHSNNISACTQPILGYENLPSHTRWILICFSVIWIIIPNGFQWIFRSIFSPL